MGIGEEEERRRAQRVWGPWPKAAAAGVGSMARTVAAGVGSMAGATAVAMVGGFGDWIRSRRLGKCIFVQFFWSKFQLTSANND